MNKKIEQIKEDMKAELKGGRIMPVGNVLWLLKVAEAAEEFVESFENYVKDTYHNCITGPEDKCIYLRKALEDK